MPEVTVRRRVRRRHASPSERLERWAYRHKPQIIVAAVFVAAALIGAICLSVGLNTLGASGGASEATQAQ